MAHFYGELQGARGEATRLGHKSSGLRTAACSWEGRINVYLDHDTKLGKDTYRIDMKQHGSSRGWEGCIASGYLGEPPGRAPCDRTDAQAIAQIACYLSEGVNKAHKAKLDADPSYELPDGHLSFMEEVSKRAVAMHFEMKENRCAQEMNENGWPDIPEYTLYVELGEWLIAHDGGTDEQFMAHFRFQLQLLAAEAAQRTGVPA